MQRINEVTVSAMKMQHPGHGRLTLGSIILTKRQEHIPNQNVSRKRAAFFIAMCVENLQEKMCPMTYTTGVTTTIQNCCSSDYFYMNMAKSAIR